MNQERLGEIQAQVEGWNEGFADNEILCRANGIILCVPGLLDEIARLHALVEQRAARSLKAAWAGEQHIAELDAKNKQLVAALRLAESLCYDNVSFSVSLDGKVRGVHQCKACFAVFRSWEPGDKHTDDCVFAILEGGDTFAQKEGCQDNS